MKKSKIKGKALFQTQGIDFTFPSGTRSPSDSESDAGSPTMDVDIEGAIDDACLFPAHMMSNAAENRRLLKRHYQVRYLIASESVRITG